MQQDHWLVEGLRCAADLSWARAHAKGTPHYPRNDRGRRFAGEDNVTRRKRRKLKKALRKAVGAHERGDTGCKLTAYLAGLALSKPRAFARLLAHILVLDLAELKKQQRATAPRTHQPHAY